MPNLLENIKFCHSYDVEIEKIQLSELGLDLNIIDLKLFKYADKMQVESEFHSYQDDEEIPKNPGELCILGRRGLRNFVKGYPYRAKFVLVELSLNINIIYFVAGFIRRYVLGLSRLNAMIRLTKIFFVKGKLLPYLLIENRNARVTTHFSVSDEIGYVGFLKYLHSEKIDYVVLRFFENLPDRARPDGDLDVLVSDDGYQKVIQFLEANPGPNMVDMYSVTGPANAARIPYYLPALSKKILREKIKCAKGYNVQDDTNYLFSLIYHCLYHKGISSGIATKYNNVNVSKNPDNDYLRIIKNIGVRAGIDCGDTLEELDALLDKHGWKPHRDTLELIAPTNKWLEVHLREEQLVPELGIFVVVLKEGFFEKFEMSEIESFLLHNNYHVFQSERLIGTRKELVTDHLRGGNWSSTGSKRYNPGGVITIGAIGLEGKIARAQKLPLDIRKLKLRMRKKFDDDKQSYIHITDTTHQSLQYLEVIDPDKISIWCKFIADHDLERRASYPELILTWVNILAYKVKLYFKGFFTRIFSRWS